MKKLSMLLVAVLAMAMIIGFAGCKQESDASSAPSTVPTWEMQEDDGAMVLSAYSDGTWKLVTEQGTASTDYAKGTYTGDATKDGSINIKVTHQADGLSGSLVKLDTPTEAECTISDSGKTLKVPSSLFGVSSGPDYTFTRK